MRPSNPARVIVVTTLLAAGSFSGGCASIVHGGNRDIKIASEPAGAKATVTKNTGELVVVSNTPCTVSLDPKRGYFKGQTYHLKLELPGYQTTELDLQPTLSGWYWGNIVFGGLIGMIAVDPVTGSMWNIEPKAIDQKMHATQAQLTRERHGFIVVLVSELTPAEKQQMTKIN